MVVVGARSLLVQADLAAMKLVKVVDLLTSPTQKTGTLKLRLIQQGGIGDGYVAVMWRRWSAKVPMGDPMPISRRSLLLGTIAVGAVPLS